MTKESLINLLYRRQKAAGDRYRLANSLGVPAGVLSDVINGRRDPGPTLLEALNLERVVTYRKVVLHDKK